MSNKNNNDLLSAWMEVGRTWSKYGRAIGKEALEHVAEAIKKTAEALDTTEEKPTEKSGHHGSETTRAQRPADKSSRKRAKNRKSDLTFK
jgi:hypothetical protein